VIVVAVERPPRPSERTDRLPEPPDRPAPRSEAQPTSR
jgi:hypothetical protein